MKFLKLGDSLEALMDYRGKTPKKLGADFTDEGVPVASALLVANGVLDLADPRFVSLATWQSWMSTPTRKGDVLLTSEAPLGRVARVLDNNPLVLGQRLFGLRGRANILDNGYLYYALQSERVQGDLQGRATGTTVFGIRQSALRDLPIPAPDFDTQVAIAEVLGALDDKIAANGLLIETAETLALALAEQSEPSAPLGDLVFHHKRILSPGTMIDEGVAHYSLPAFDSAHSPDIVTPSRIKSGKFEIGQQSVLVSKLNPRFPRIWDLPEIGPMTAMASTEFLVLESRYSSSTVLWSVVSQPAFSSSLESQVAGTSGSHQRVRPADLLATEVIDPRMMGDQVKDSITSLGRCIASYRTESTMLALLRDTLLPELMSGRLRVKDAERAVGEAV